MNYLMFKLIKYQFYFPQHLPSEQLNIGLSKSFIGVVSSKNVYKNGTFIIYFNITNTITPTNKNININEKILLTIIYIYIYMLLF